MCHHRRLGSAGDQTRRFIHSRQISYQLRNILSSPTLLLITAAALVHIKQNYRLIFLFSEYSTGLDRYGDTHLWEDEAGGP